MPIKKALKGIEKVSEDVEHIWNINNLNNA